MLHILHHAENIYNSSRAKRILQLQSSVGNFYWMPPMRAIRIRNFINYSHRTCKSQTIVIPVQPSAFGMISSVSGKVFTPLKIIMTCRSSLMNSTRPNEVGCIFISLTVLIFIPGTPMVNCRTFCPGSVSASKKLITYFFFSVTFSGCKKVNDTVLQQRIISGSHQCGLMDFFR